MNLVVFLFNQCDIIDAPLHVPAARGIEVADAHRAALLACADHVTLDRRLARAATARPPEEVLAQ
jgi:hypothetical protein